MTQTSKAYAIPRNISVPSTAFNNNQGSYQISPIPFTNGTKFLLTMSDATGFGTGGTSELLTVGTPVGSASCNTSNPALLYSFSLPSSLQQCGYAEDLNPTYLRNSPKHQLLHLQRLRRGHLTRYNHGLSDWTFGPFVALIPFASRGSFLAETCSYYILPQQEQVLHGSPTLQPEPQLCSQ